MFDLYFTFLIDVDLEPLKTPTSSPLKKSESPTKKKTESPTTSPNTLSKVPNKRKTTDSTADLQSKAKQVSCENSTNTDNSRYLELSRDQQICSRHREFDLSSSHFV